ncbi:hypothetical protein [Burkholderia vietnamiensis]|uniref:hypothetical protein n=1 Tax=Burkholderia vietnamiensis TaxID=60552 RepID=UPI000AF23395|nr:hypothetical protein [Burkholderia vietnamiensis]
MIGHIHQVSGKMLDQMETIKRASITKSQRTKTKRSGRRPTISMFKFPILVQSISSLYLRRGKRISVLHLKPGVEKLLVENTPPSRASTCKGMRTWPLQREGRDMRKILMAVIIGQVSSGAYAQLNNLVPSIKDQVSNKVHSEVKRSVDHATDQAIRSTRTQAQSAADSLRASVARSSEPRQIKKP